MLFAVDITARTSAIISVSFCVCVGSGMFAALIEYAPARRYYSQSLLVKPAASGRVLILAYGLLGVAE
jgi:nitric oxide reductase large subunit